MDGPSPTLVKIVPVIPDNLPVIYSNFAMVNMSAHEYFLTFCLIQPTSQEVEGQTSIPAEAKLRLIMPHGVVRGLLEAIAAQDQALGKETAAETPDGG